MLKCDDTTLTDVFCMSPNAQSLHVRDCGLPPGMMIHLLKQLTHCRQLTKLDVSDTNLGAAGHHLSESINSWGVNSPLQVLQLHCCEMPQDDLLHVIKSLSACKHLTRLDLSNTTLGDGGHHLADCVASWGADPPLKDLWLDDCEMPQDASVEVVKSLSACKHLAYLGLSCNTLTGTLSGLDPHPGLHSLEMLGLSDTALNKDDILHLSHLMKTNKLPRLKHLVLSDNILTGTLSGLDPHPGLHSLDELHLDCTALNKDDILHLSHLMKTNKLPRLKVLVLSDNILTGTLSGLDPHQGLHLLKELYLNCAALNKDDIRHLSHLMKMNKLPQLTELDLSMNNLCEMEDELVRLIEACVTHHQRRLWLSVLGNHLSKEFEEKWWKRCEGTKIGLCFYF